MDGVDNMAEDIEGKHCSKASNCSGGVGSRPRGNSLEESRQNDPALHQVEDAKGRSKVRSKTAKRVHELRTKIKDKVEELRQLVAPADIHKTLPQLALLDRAVSIIEDADEDVPPSNPPSIHNLADVLLLVDRTGRISHAMESDARLLGYPDGELHRHSHISELVHWTEVSGVQGILSRMEPVRITLHLRDSGLDYKEFHVLARPMNINNLQLMLLSCRLIGTKRKPGYEPSHVGRAPPVRYSKVWAIHNIEVNTVMAWAGNSSDTICGFPAMYMAKMPPFCFIHPEDLPNMIELHGKTVKYQRVGMMRNRLFTFHHTWIMSENTLYPCVNRRTGKVEYTLTETVHFDSMSASPMPSRAHENRLIPYEPVYFDDVTELIEQCTRLSIDGRRQFDEWVARADELDTRHVLNEHVRLLDYHNPRGRSSQRQGSDRFGPPSGTNATGFGRRQSGDLQRDTHGNILGAGSQNSNQSPNCQIGLGDTRRSESEMHDLQSASGRPTGTDGFRGSESKLSDLQLAQNRQIGLDDHNRFKSENYDFQQAPSRQSGLDGFSGSENQMCDLQRTPSQQNGSGGFNSVGGDLFDKQTQPYRPLGTRWGQAADWDPPVSQPRQPATTGGDLALYSNLLPDSIGSGEHRVRANMSLSGSVRAPGSSTMLMPQSARSLGIQSPSDVSARSTKFGYAPQNVIGADAPTGPGRPEQDMVDIIKVLCAASLPDADVLAIASGLGLQSDITTAYPYSYEIEAALSSHITEDIGPTSSPPGAAYHSQPDKPCAGLGLHPSNTKLPGNTPPQG